MEYVKSPGKLLSFGTSFRRPPSVSDENALAWRYDACGHERWGISRTGCSPGPTPRCHLV